MFRTANWRQLAARAVSLIIVGLALASSLWRADPAGAQIDPLVLGRAVDATAQLSIIVRGTVDGEEQLIWYAAGSGTIVSPRA